MFRFDRLEVFLKGNQTASGGSLNLRNAFFPHQNGSIPTDGFEPEEGIVFVRGTQPVKYDSVNVDMPTRERTAASGDFSVFQSKKAIKAVTLPYKGSIYLEPKFWENMTEAGQRFVLLHEMFHRYYSSEWKTDTAAALFAFSQTQIDPRIFLGINAQNLTNSRSNTERLQMAKQWIRHQLSRSRQYY